MLTNPSMIRWLLDESEKNYLMTIIEQLDPEQPDLFFKQQLI